MEIKRVKLSELLPDPSNVRKHNEKNISAIKASLTKFGLQKPIVISKDNIIIAGNGTVEAAKQLGWTEMDCTVSDLTGTNQAAFGIADNRTSELAEWDTEALAKTLNGLKLENFNLDDLGFFETDLPSEFFNNDMDEKEDTESDKKYILEIEFPDEQARKDEYEKLVSSGLIVRFK